MKKGKDKVLNPLISIIVPIYNADEYLQKCLDSLISQTMDEIEIILVNDGSEDGSAAICDAMAKQDSRVRVRHNPHKGVSAARNDALDMAHGKYIMFTDSDDWVEPDFCRIPFDVAEQTGSDLVIFRFLTHGKNGKLMKDEKCLEEGFVSKENILIKDWEVTGSYSWNKLFKRELFENIRYPEGKLFEDIAIMSDIIYNAQRVYVTNVQLYHYNSNREGSTTNTKARDVLSDYFEYEFQRIDSLKKWGYDCNDEEEKIALNYLLAFGAHEKESNRCHAIISKLNKPNRAFDWKYKMAFYLYRCSKLLFDAASVITGKRINEGRKIK